QPGMDTLVLAARVPDRTSFADPNSQTLVFDPLASRADPISLINQYQANLTMYVLELQQLIRHNGRNDTNGRVKFGFGARPVDNTEIVPAGSPLVGIGF